MKRAVATAAAFILGSAISGCGASSSDSDSAGQIGQPDVSVDAQKILKEFENNEATADGKYKGKTIEVSGVVDKVDTEMFDEEKYVVRVGPGKDFAILTVNCNGLAAADVNKIKKGEDVTVVGVFDDGGDLGVELSPCQVQK